MEVTEFCFLMKYGFTTSAFYTKDLHISKFLQYRKYLQQKSLFVVLRLCYLNQEFCYILCRHSTFKKYKVNAYIHIVHLSLFHLWHMSRLMPQLGEGSLGQLYYFEHTQYTIHTSHSLIRHYFYSNLYVCTPRGPRSVKESEFFVQKKLMSSCAKIEPELRKLQKTVKIEKESSKIHVFLLLFEFYSIQAKSQR